MINQSIFGIREIKIEQPKKLKVGGWCADLLIIGKNKEEPLRITLFTGGDKECLSVKKVKTLPSFFERKK